MRRPSPCGEQSGSVWPRDTLSVRRDSFDSSHSVYATAAIRVGAANDEGRLLQRMGFRIRAIDARGRHGKEIAIGSRSALAIRYALQL
jgi:hypothetical protein